MKKYGKFAALIVVVVGTVVGIAMTGFKSNQTYYKTVAELDKMGDQAYGKRLRVGGDIESGSIQHKDRQVHFVLVQDKLRLNVVYDESELLPDAFRDGAQALAEGEFGKDQVFHARKLPAKCASKYEAKPGQLAPGQAPPNINTGKGRI